MATTKNAPKTVHMTANVLGRVTDRTRTPYIARVMNNAGEPTPLVILVNQVNRVGRGIPACGQAVVLTNRPGALFYAPGDTIRVDNFRCLRRLELTSITDA